MVSQLSQLFQTEKEYAAFGGGKAWVIPTGAKTREAAQNSLTS